ncbi:MAG: sulfatase-like hydrolase/transferase [Phycisphaerae bacterium]|nr:sulfatase-like hydrolase/transferase [Phycisphaerae bacterium]
MPARLPNLLWIVTTQWRAQACGFAGDPQAHTPSLDALAVVAVNHTQAVTPHPFGPFARAALLTGVPSPENGVQDYFDPLPVETRTIAHRLAAAGYATSSAISTVSVCWQGWDFATSPSLLRRASPSRPRRAAPQPRRCGPTSGAPCREASR